MMNLLWKWLNMPATLAGQISILVGLLTVFGTLIAIARWADRRHKENLKHVEWLEILAIDYARRTPGFTLSEEIIKRHMRLNGFDKLPSDEKDKIYGPNRPRGDSGNHKTGDTK